MHNVAARGQPMSLADILNATFNLYGANFKLIAGIATLVLFPEAIIVTALFTGGSYAFLVGGGVVSLAGSVIVTGALAQAVSARRAGREIRIMEAYRGLGGATAMALMGVAFISALLVMLGLALFIVPGIYIGVRLVIGAPIAVMERRGARDSIRRSWNLVQAEWWRVFGVVAGISVLALGLELTVGRLLGSVTGNALGLGLSTAVVDILVQPVQSIALTFLYFDLLGRKGDQVMQGPGASSTGTS